MVSKQKLVFETSNFACSKQKYAKEVVTHYFNHAVSFIVPESQQIPEEIEKHMSAQPHYIVYDMPLVKLISEEFIQAFVKTGSIYMITDEQTIDTKNCVALLPTGVLILNVTKDLYQELGLEGQVSKFHSKTKMKYIIRIDLMLPEFQPGKKIYDRVRWCFNERLDLKFNFLITWVPNDDTVCPSSIESYLKSLGLVVSQGDVNKVQHSTKVHSIPILNSQSHDRTDDSCSFLDAYEWLSFVACGCEFGATDDFVNSVTCPEPNMFVKVSHLKVNGFFVANQILSVISYLREWVKSASLPWACITVHGFMDSPVTWNETEHGYHINGDNLYTFIVFPNDNYWFYSATGSSDIVS